MRYLGIRQLFETSIKEHPDHRYLPEPFIYVTQVCNATMHAQNVSSDQAKEALALGAQIIAQLSSFAEGAAA